MTKMEAIVRPEKLEELQHQLEEIGPDRNDRDGGPRGGPAGGLRGALPGAGVPVRLLPKVKDRGRRPRIAMVEDVVRRPSGAPAAPARSATARSSSGARRGRPHPHRRPRQRRAAGATAPREKPMCSIAPRARGSQVAALGTCNPRARGLAKVYGRLPPAPRARGAMLHSGAATQASRRRGGG